MQHVGRLKPKGFTIVELLIVIVVIAILAALVLNGFGTAQIQARNAQTTHAAEAYKKGLLAYRIANGSFPASASYACLGGAYSGSKCWDNINYATVASFDAALQTTMGATLPMPATTARPYEGILFAPASTGWLVDGKATNLLIYALEGSTTRCPVGPIVTYTGTGVSFTSATPAQGYTQQQPGTNPTEVGCWVNLDATAN